MSASKFRYPSRIFCLLCGLVCLAFPLSAQTVTFSGRVADQNTGLGVPGVAVVAQGNNSGTRVALTDAQGNYTLPFGSSSNIRLRCYRTQYVFNPALAVYASIGGVPIVGSIQRDFTGLALPFPILVFAQTPILLTENDSLNALGLDSVLQTRDPLATSNNSYFGSDKRTRIQLYVVDLDLYSGETIAIISGAAFDSQQVSHTLTVEDLRRVPDVPWMSQLTLRLPSDMVGPGEFFVYVTVRGQMSSGVRIRLK